MHFNHKFAVIHCRGLCENVMPNKTCKLLLRKSTAPGLHPGQAEETFQAHHLSTHKELSEAMIGLARKLSGFGSMSPDLPQIAPTVALKKHC